MVERHDHRAYARGSAIRQKAAARRLTLEFSRAGISRCRFTCGYVVRFIIGHDAFPFTVRPTCRLWMCDERCSV